VDALAGAGSFLYGGGRKGEGRRRRRILRGPGIVEGRYLHDFLGNSFLETVFAALEVPSLLEDLFEGFLAVRNGDPGVAVPARTPEPDGEVPRHESSLRILMIPVCRESSGGPPEGFPRKVNGGEE
jgi:hypothetical protein